jgi:hypothetical protein
MSDLHAPSGEFGECPCHRRASLRLPPLEFRAQSIFTAIDERPDCLRVRLDVRPRLC